MDTLERTLFAEREDVRLEERRRVEEKAGRAYFWREDAQAALDAQQEVLEAQSLKLSRSRGVTVVSSDVVESRAAKAMEAMRASRREEREEREREEGEARERAERVARVVKEQERVRKNMLARKSQQQQPRAGDGGDGGDGEDGGVELGLYVPVPFPIVLLEGTVLLKHTREGKGKLHERVFVLSPTVGGELGISWFREGMEERATAVLEGVRRGVPPLFNWEKAKDVTRSRLEGLGEWRHLSLVLDTSVGPVYVVAQGGEEYREWAKLIP